MSLSTFSITLVGTKKISPSVMHFQFRRTDKHVFDFIPGQFITLHLDQHHGKKLRRSYSIASIPGKEDSLDFAASYVTGGIASELLFNLKIGAELQALGPAGRLVLKNEDHPKRYLLVATGTGVTPYRSMLPELEKRIQTESLEVFILEGVRTKEELLYYDDFSALMKRHPKLFHFAACYSRQPQVNEPYEHRGYVSKYLTQLNPDPLNDIVYLCGNPNMIDDIYQQLKQCGFDVARVRREKYISSGAAS